MNKEDQDKIRKLIDSAEEAGANTVGKAMHTGGLVVKTITFIVVAAAMMAIAFLVGSFLRKRDEDEQLKYNEPQL